MIKNRHTIRLKNYDYSQSGWYFVTICTQNRENVFGEIIGNTVGAIHESPNLGNDSPAHMKLNETGKIIEYVWKSLPNRFPIILDEFQIMPNHVHMIIHIVVRAIHNDDVRAIHESPLHKRSLLSQIIGYLKMNSAKLIHQINPNIPVWQRNYYERIIRNEEEYINIKKYIQANPSAWEKDENNPTNTNFVHTVGV